MDPKRSELYERVVEDMGQTLIDYQAWFEAKSKQYGWKSVPGGKWMINFETCEVSLS